MKEWLKQASIERLYGDFNSEEDTLVEYMVWIVLELEVFSEHQL